MPTHETQAPLRIIGGDKTALEETFQAEYGPVAAKLSLTAYKFANGCGLTPQDAEDCLQIALIKAWTKFPSFLRRTLTDCGLPAASFSTWVTAIVRNEMVSLLRKRRPLCQADLDVDIETLSEQDDAVENEEAVTALAALDEDVREAAMQLIEELGDLNWGWRTVIARMLGVHHTTVSRRIIKYVKGTYTLP